MKYAVLAGVVFLTICSLGDLSGQAPAPANQARDTEEIERSLRAWGDAMIHRDAQALSRLLADDFTFVSPRGRLITKAVYVRNRDASGVFGAESARFDDVSVRFYSRDFAVSTSRYTSKSQVREPLTNSIYDNSNEFTRTDTWVKRDGRWQAVATQITPIGYPGAHAAADSTALRGVNGNELKWLEYSASPGAQFAVLHGMPYSGGYAIRLKRPDGHVEQPHRHESDEHVAVMSGILHVGVGDALNRTTARTFREGSYVVIPSGTVHYSWAEGDVLADVYWTGAAAPVSATPSGRR